MAKLVIADFSGGINTGQPPSGLQPNESISTRNYRIYGKKLVRRGGMRRVNTYANRYALASEVLTGFFSYRPTAGAMSIVGTSSRLAFFNGTFTAITVGGVTSIGAGSLPWIFFQYKDILYAFRTGSGGFFRSKGITYDTAGVAAPASAPTLADGVAGVIPAANFYGVYTYYNTATGVESNPSPVSLVLAHGATLKINWTGITASPNSQVDARRLYRSLPNQQGAYYRVDPTVIAEIQNNSTTFYTGDNQLVQGLGDPASFNNGLPPSNMAYGDVWRDRLWCTDGIDLFVSEVGMLEAFADSDSGGVIRVLPDDGHKIRGICAWGDRVVVGKTGAVYYITGTDPDNFSRQTLSDRHGVASHYSMKVAEGSIFWLGPDDVYRSDGGKAYGIGNPKIKQQLDALRDNDPTLISAVTAGVLPELHQYRLALPDGMMVYDYQTGAWSEEGLEADFVPVLADYIDANYTKRLYGVAVTSIYEIGDKEYNFDDRPTEDVTDNIQAYLESRELDFGDPSSRHVVRRLHVLAPQIPETFSAKFITDRNATQPALRTGMSLDLPSPWKSYSLSSLRQTMSGSRLALLYAGVQPLEIEGVALDYDDLQRFNQPT